jgi:hypothetical protein
MAPRDLLHLPQTWFARSLAAQEQLSPIPKKPRRAYNY